MYDAGNCVISYIPEAYGITTKNIVGRQAAGHEFLKAFVTYSGQDDFLCLTTDIDNFKKFRQQVASFRSKPFTAYQINSHDIYSLAHAGNIYWPDPDLSRLAWLRHSLGDDAYSLFGITHSLSDMEVIRALQNLLICPVCEWDALICTSEAARKTVQAILEDWSLYLMDRTGSHITSPVQLPVIPLGVDTVRYMPAKKKIRNGKKLRSSLGIPENATVGLYFGRLNFLTKSHPTPMFLAFEQAAARIENGELHLVVVGQFNNQVVKEECESLALIYCSKANVHWLDGNDERVSTDCWYAADFFISLSDNMQETFGLTTVEAMAASLPCIVSDWSGLKESVIHGETGFLIPTNMPGGNYGADFLRRAVFEIDDFGDSVAALNQVISTDIKKCVEAIVVLANNKSLRTRFSKAARARAVDKFDWKKIIKQYQDLWRHLGEIRVAHSQKAVDNRKIWFPGHANPFRIFQHFASGNFNRKTILSLSTNDALNFTQRLQQNMSHLLFSPMMLPYPDIFRLIELIGNDRLSIQSILDKNPAWHEEKLLYTVAWLHKYNVLICNFSQDN